MIKYFNSVDVVDGCLILGGLTISLQDVQSILSIIILVLDGLWILFKFMIKFFRYISDGKLTEEELNDLENDINNNINKENKESEK